MSFCSRRSKICVLDEVRMHAARSRTKCVVAVVFHSGEWTLFWTMWVQKFSGRIPKHLFVSPFQVCLFLLTILYFSPLLLFKLKAIHKFRCTSSPGKHREFLIEQCLWNWTNYFPVDFPWIIVRWSVHFLDFRLSNKLNIQLFSIH